jgi:hypothetical protein
MKQVISASRRTDLPAFYMKWLLEKVKNKQVMVPNPFNRKQTRLVSLSPKEVAWFVFWSRNYRKFLQNYQVFLHYQCFFHFTINPSHSLLEPDMIPPQKGAIIGTDPVYIGYSKPAREQGKYPFQDEFMQAFDSVIYQMGKSGEISEIMNAYQE